jgi:hypothetical protein
MARNQPSAVAFLPSVTVPDLRSAGAYTAVMNERAALSRRSALKALGMGAGAAAFVPWLSDEGLLAFQQVQRLKTAPKLLVLSPAQYATLDALAEAIIPADDRSPGARAARVADYIDLLLSELDKPVQLQWIGGIAELDDESRMRYKRPFTGLTAAERDGLLTAISKNERSPETPLEAFFAMAKSATITGYYSSEIGIHQELRYKGNQMIEQFAGCLTEDGKDCPHCAQKAKG